jgi:hypothetical protein
MAGDRSSGADRVGYRYRQPLPDCIRNRQRHRAGVGWHYGGWLRLWAGQPDFAIEHFETGLRLSPRDRGGKPALGIGVGHFFARRFQEARGMLLQSLDEKPTWIPTYRFLAACYAHMGRLCEAHETVARLRAMTPVVIPNAAHLAYFGTP